MKNRLCRRCGMPLVIGENVTQYRIDHRQYICRKCRREYNQQRANPEKQAARVREWRHRTGRQRPMSENRDCSSFLGVHVAERVLSYLFKNVVRMPYCNIGYDFKCGKGYLVDVKSSCRYHSNIKTQSDRWIFSIKKNQIAEYFLCLAFDNRESLHPEHVWLIPASDVNDHSTISVSETTLSKWSKYERPVNQVATCCDILKGS